MKKKAGSFKEWVIWQLRRLSYRWPARSEAFRNAAASRADFERANGKGKVTKRVRNFYWCALCEGVFTRKQVSADHIEPVIDPKKGFVDFNTYIVRLFCAASNFQIICDECHDGKTAKERKVRSRYKKRR
jgi:hypothetical protein